MINLLHILKRQKRLFSGALILIVLSCSQPNDTAVELPSFELLLTRFQQGARFDMLNEVDGIPLTGAPRLDHYACADAIINSSSSENNGIDWE
ncbi:hypothetical protein [Gynuella sp.]|uniref:hypothetical protein n=1 Tax=Gynuella sp. TaxID=2969146 RepID=UPI003D11B8BD